MNSPVPKRIGVVAALAALASFGAVGTLPLSPRSLDWLTTFSATLVSAALAAAVAVWLYFFETGDKDDRERARLRLQLAMEAQLNLDVLGERPAEILHSRTGEPVARVVLVQLPLSALEDLTRSGLEDPEETSGLMRIAAHARVHNNDVATLLSARTGSMTENGIIALAEDVNRRQQILHDALEGILEGLEEVGTEPPSITDPEGGPRVDPFLTGEEARRLIRGRGRNRR